MDQWVTQSDIKIQGSRLPTPPIFGKSKRVSIRSAMKFASSGDTHAIKELNSRESQRRQAFTPVIGGQNQRTGSQDSVQNMKPKLEEKPSELKVRD
jgi:hypothetical protein